MPLPEQSSKRTSITAIVALALALVAATGLYLSVRYLRYSQKSVASPSPSLSELIRTGEAPRPALREDNTIAVLEKKKSFQALVSYTDQGFEPTMLTIKKGGIIRFTNNSSESIQLLVDSKSVSEHDLLPQQYAEVSFETKGTYQYNTAPDTAKGGTVQVQ